MNEEEAREKAKYWLQGHRFAVDLAVTNSKETARSWLFKAEAKDKTPIYGGFAIVVDKKTGEVSSSSEALLEFVPTEFLTNRQRLKRWWHCRKL